MWRASEGRCAAAVVDGGYCARERRTGRIGHDWQGVSLCGMPHGVAVNVTALRASVAISGVFFCLRGSSVLPQPQLPLVAGCALEILLGFQNSRPRVRTTLIARQRCWASSSSRRRRS